MNAAPHNLRSHPCFAELASTIFAHAEGRPIVFIPNHGNWGDALIAEGTREFFRFFGLRAHEISFKAMSRYPWLKSRLATLGREPLIVYGGGGALAGQYPRHVQKVAEMLRAGTRSMILPSTFGDNASLFTEIPELLAYRRDEFESRENFARARFCHDMALFLSPPPVEVRRKRAVFLRGDREKGLGCVEIDGSRDISVEGTHETPVGEFFHAIGAAEEIWTDRLHVAIAGALLGREVHLLPNSYFKNRAVFLSSLAPNFLNVHFHRDFADLWASREVRPF